MTSIYTYSFSGHVYNYDYVIGANKIRYSDDTSPDANSA